MGLARTRSATATATNAQAVATLPIPVGIGNVADPSRRWRVIAFSGSVSAGAAQVRLEDSDGNAIWVGEATVGGQVAPDLGVHGISIPPGKGVRLEVDDAGAANRSSASLLAFMEA